MMTEIRDHRDREAQAMADFYRAAAGMIATVINTVEAYDGKIYNVKLDRALRTASDGTVHVSDTGYSISIEMHTTTTPSRTTTLARISRGDLLEGKRIPADAIARSAQDMRERLIAKAAAIEEHMGRIEEYKERIEQAGKDLRAMAHEIPDELRDIYQLPHRIDF